MGPLLQITFDCADPGAQARFWAAAVGYQEQPPPEGYESWDQLLEQMGVPEDERNSRSAVVDPDGLRPRLFFQRVPEAKTVKNRLHLDVRVGVGLTGDERVAALEAEAARLETLGARRLRLLPADEENEACLVMQDVEGNEFCLD